ncbi:MAG: hypothetical protein A2W99_08400 [Bacteroidetes bacterium GWF2_33_16]|nr:MAG: hypothetical protein A2X00_00755 [Bacteroidetes bacterium GWE2_32_14]OFY05525.1 MAG: hypothetical protein A2W99_08400 [Bacteroidetes bacterium GWF2_33_16]
MKKKDIYLGSTLLNSPRKEVKGLFVTIDGEKFYKISNYDQMPDFFISIISGSNHWMFISSNGSLTAGRKNRNNALFPYFTVDKIHDYRGKTGSSTSVIIEKQGKYFLWEPFSSESEYLYSIERNIYKSIYGNKIIFEEINHDLNVKFKYGWYNSEKFGFIKKSAITNLDSAEVTVNLLDGIKNILPPGIDFNFQNEYSNLLDAYKKNELVEESNLGLFALSSIPVDRAEPSESLNATTVWSHGFDHPKILISTNQTESFKKGNNLETEKDIRAKRGAYFINSEITLKRNEEKKWMLVAEVNQDSTAVSNLNHFLTQNTQLDELVDADILNGTTSLKRMVSCADGFQMTDTDLCYARHYSNTMYNSMRGGVFANNYFVETSDYKNYLKQINRMVSKEFQSWLNQLPEKILYPDLIKLVKETGNDNLQRISYEYLPLTFSRRHGDPSRPWNIFSIETKNDDGSVKYNYEGNWRDIFQNWEALSYSYPEFVEGMICKFVNASTLDGYNPYRIMRNGIDWECPDPKDPWAYIGYWGDHQIIYLQKLLEISTNFHPERLDDFLVNEIFTYANVPYQIKSFDEIIKNPKNTITFNEELNTQIKSEVEYLGADARLLKRAKTDHIYRVNLTEKILVTLLTKLSNFIPEAGIWLNTQRPEWNDANNALVGNGTSMVTLYYLRRFLKFWEAKFNNVSINDISISDKVATLFYSVFSFLDENSNLVNNGFSDEDRGKFANFLGKAHSKYRNEIYMYSFTGEKKQIKVDELLAFTRLCLKYIDHSIIINKREDGLYHAYNLITIRKNKISIRHLYEMLEGQVAILSAGFLSPQESLEVLDSLKNSKMFRHDQYSYMLYPDRKLPLFVEKNVIPLEKITESKLLSKLLENNDTSIIKVDNKGDCHFNGAFRNASVLEEALDNLRYGEFSHLVEDEKQKVLEIYEEIFDHKSFTGRSGAFYGYEGLGSIYWHMVSKLLLATQECYFNAIDQGARIETINRLKDHYYEIKAGIGLYKSPDLYGAFPTDAYSHTPANAGVKQPGLTGQVKEDVISRIGELGIRIKNGEIIFDTSLLNYDEILKDNAEFEYFTLNGKQSKILLKQGQLALTFCQTPMVYTFSDANEISISFRNGNKEKIQGNTISNQISSMVFNRSNEIELIEITVKNDNSN